MQIKISSTSYICIYWVYVLFFVLLCRCGSSSGSISGSGGGCGVGAAFADDRSDLSANDRQSASKANCCDETMVITSDANTEGYLKAPPVYEDTDSDKSSTATYECLYKFYGRPDERIQLFYVDFDLYYPYDIHKFNKIDCRYADSICLKFYENANNGKEKQHHHQQQQQQHQQLSKQQKSKKNVSLSSSSLSSSLSSSSSSAAAAATMLAHESVSLENHNYDICNCINVSFTPRQIMSASNFMQVRFKTVPRSFDSLLGLNAKKNYRGYLIRYKFTKEFGIDTTDSGVLHNSDSCQVTFNSTTRREGYFSSPNYPGLYPRDIECHYFFIGERNQKVQITFHTFDVEGVEQCRAETKSDFVELSNFQNRDRIYSRFCGVNKPAAIISDGSFFHVTFYSNNVFDGKGFQASYHFITSKDNVNKNAAAAAAAAQAQASNSEAAAAAVAMATDASVRSGSGAGATTALHLRGVMASSLLLSTSSSCSSPASGSSSVVTSVSFFYFYYLYYLYNLYSNHVYLLCYGVSLLNSYL